MSNENKNTNNDFLLEDDLDMDGGQNDVKNEFFFNNNYEQGKRAEKKVFDFEEEEKDDHTDDEDEDIDDEDIDDEEIDDEEIESMDSDDKEDVINDKEDDEEVDDSRHELARQNEEEKVNDTIIISKSKIVLAKALFDNIKESNERLIQIFSSLYEDNSTAKISLGQIGEIEYNENKEEGSIIEGVFDGENMIGPDGKQYSVPANYASKSKLVEGDILKLTITGKGTFVYKQIGPIERLRVVGELGKDDDDFFIVHADGKRWKILPASVTYFKGNIGDEVVLLVPKAGESKWAAVENIIRNKEHKEYLNESY